MQKSVFEYEFNSARNALRVLVQGLKIRKIHIPFYICPVVKNALRKENCEIEYYHIDENFFPVCDFEVDDYILYPNYYGICTKNVKRLSEKYPKLIVDNAHSFYSSHFGLASFNSYRKFFFFSDKLKDGACLKVNDSFEFEYPCGETADEDIDFSYSSLLKNERRIDEAEIMMFSETSRRIFQNIDFEKDKKERLSTFFEFDKEYRAINELKIELKEDEIPFVYPLLTYDEGLAEKITKGNDLILRYWNTLPENFPEYRFYKYLIPIPLTKLINHC